MKERRKNQPSAVSQRRMNFEERRQIYNNDISEERNSSEVKDKRARINIDDTQISKQRSFAY